MFTGLIEDLGSVDSLQRGARQCSLTVATGLPTKELQKGESIAVNGVCLTVTRFGDGRFTADVSPETLEVTTLGKLQRGSRVNLERALRLSDRLGGHLVTGHVDSLAHIVERSRDANAWRFHFQLDNPTVAALLVAKGSVAVDGISLTVNTVSGRAFSVAIIPHTLEATTLVDRQVGEVVNIETDLIGKYVARLLKADNQAEKTGITTDILAKHGFL
ncbi:MAG TPA: riboflavin synthase [Desulfuromonadales bacterium]|nr:riboflavin synthase [Desulfuromonadales bacterium]